MSGRVLINMQNSVVRTVVDFSVTASFCDKVAN